MNDLLLRGHLGLGDAIICNALVRHLAEKHFVCVLCKHHNMSSVAFMFRDLVNVELFGVAGDDNDKEADEVTAHAEQQGYPVLRLGFTGAKPFDIQKWDQEFYRQASVPFSDCWNKFKVARQPSKEIQKFDMNRDYVFIHEDKDRGCIINEKYLPRKRTRGISRVYAVRGITDNIFDWWGVVENAKEIHVMESSFAILIDHLPEVKAKRICVHEYCRKSIAPTYQNSFERIKE